MREALAVEAALKLDAIAASRSAYPFVAAVAPIAARVREA